MKVYPKIIFIFILCIFQNANALTIVSPKEGQVVYQGDRLPVIVKPDVGENWTEVLFYVFPMRYNDLTGQYEEEMEIPRDDARRIWLVRAYVSSLGKAAVAL